MKDPAKHGLGNTHQGFLLVTGVNAPGGASGGGLGGGGLCRVLKVSGNQDAGSAADTLLCELGPVTSLLWLSISFLFIEGVTIHKVCGGMPGTKEALPKCF